MDSSKFLEEEMFEFYCFLKDKGYDEVPYDGKIFLAKRISDYDDGLISVYSMVRDSAGDIIALSTTEEIFSIDSMRRNIAICAMLGEPL